MDSFDADKSDSALIKWNTPEMVKIKTHEDYLNNPFDVLELKAASMDPYDLVPCQTSLFVDPPCGNILSPLWEPKIRQIRKSVSLINIDGVGKMVKQNYVELINIDSVEGSTKDLQANEENVNQSEKDDVLVNAFDIKIDNQEQNIEPVWTPNSSKVGLENASFCNEDEKKIIREQTRQKIEMLIEKGKSSSRKSIFCTPKRSSESSLDKTESCFNKAIVGFDSNCDSSISNKSSVSKTLDFKIDTNDNDISKVDSSVYFPIQELNSFDLESLDPEWVVDNFSDIDGSSDEISDITEPVVEPINNKEQVDDKLKFLSRIGTVESKPNRCQTGLKSMPNKRIQPKGPFLANVPLQHMVQNYEDTEIKEINRKPNGSRGPVASSTPTSSEATSSKTPSSTKCSIESPRISLSRRSVSSSIGSPSTPLNATKCIEKNKNDKILTQLRGSRLSNSAYKRSNTTIVLSSQATAGNTEIRKPIQSTNRSKSDSKIEHIPKLVASNTIHKRQSCLPVSKLSKEKKIFKGKENVN